MRLLLGGDTHGNPYQIEYLFETALSYQCDRIFVLGDYGYWEHMYGGKEFLQVTSELATLNNIPFYWLDGNHENHVMLRQTYYANPAIDGMWQIRPNLYYSPRGNRFSWDGVNFMTMGGAFSIDRGLRKVGKSFWFEEEITSDEIDAAIGDWPTPVNILLSHDLPDGVDLGRIIARRGVNYRVIREAQNGRNQLRRLVNAVRPTHIFHGHYHVRYNETVDFGYGPVRVAGLDCDGSKSDSWTIIDTADWRLANELW